MLNHRLIDPPRTPSEFIKSASDFLKRHAQGKKVFCALSGGVDSSATYLTLKEAGIDVLPVFIDHGLMRIIRGIEERDYIKKIFPDVKIIDIRTEFLPQIYGEEDAEMKRKLFKKAYSDTINKVINDEHCDLLADGTILPDIEESFGVQIMDLKETMSLEDEKSLMDKFKKGFVKSQHNLDIEYDVEATVQPVASLTKPEVRNILEYFGMPLEQIYRKAFPGPALSARIIGPVTPENLSFEKKVHDVVESSIEDYYIEKFGKPMIINEIDEQEPFQAFAAITTDVLLRKVTGIIDGQRTYEVPLIIRGEWDFEKLTRFASQIKGYARALYELHESHQGIFDVIIRSINSIDARTASVTNLTLSLIEEIKYKLLEYHNTKNIYFDITPKPPATIEYV
jgi:GMP synthase (glutamine-hydrolysing)